MVGAARFELTTPCTQNRCATRLRHAPDRGGYLIGNGPLEKPKLTASALSAARAQQGQAASSVAMAGWRISLPLPMFNASAMPPLISRMNWMLLPP